LKIQLSLRVVYTSSPSSPDVATQPPPGVRRARGSGGQNDGKFGR
jgi:hypothetical protein